MRAGCYAKDSYVFIGLLGKMYRAHRLAFLYMTGEIPQIIDHINLDKHDNKWGNLRAATVSLNGANRERPKNNKSGVKGVLYNPRDDRWIAKLKVGKRNVYLGQYREFNDAVRSQAEGAKRYFGEFARVTEI